jgi:hypothetical protein
MQSITRIEIDSAWFMATVVCLAAVACAAADAPAAREETARDDVGDDRERRQRDPLPAGALLMEQAVRGLLEAAPGAETLDDVMRRAADRNRAAVEEAQAAQIRQVIRQQAQRFEKVLERLLGSELEYVRQCCGSLPREARAEVLAAGREGVSTLATRLARLQFEGGGARGGTPDIRLAIHEKVAGALEPLAAKEEFAAYEREWRLRQERRTHAARIKIVAKIDAQIGLTEAQRRAVLEDLATRWQPSWLEELRMPSGFLVDEYPPIPDFAAAGVEPHLDPAQLTQWIQWRKAVGQFSQNFRDPLLELQGLGELSQRGRRGTKVISDWWRP